MIPNTETVAVIGAGAMGAGIAQVAAQAGHPVLMFDAAPGAAEKGRTGILSGLDRLVAKGRMTRADRDGIARRLIIIEGLHALTPARLVIEAVVERLDVKRQIFSALEAVLSPDAILATNTSSLSITAIAAGLQRPEKIAGFHFFNPAPVMKLVEVASGLATDPDVLATLCDLARAWGKVAVSTKSTPGFIVNRVARPFYAEALRVLEEGAADVVTLDSIMREAGGFCMGPFELMDLIGHDVNFAVTTSVFNAFFGDPRYRPSLVQQELVAAGWLGRKSGRGFYRYPAEASSLTPRLNKPGPGAGSVLIEGELGPAEPLVMRAEACGLAVSRTDGGGYIRVPGATLALSDGRLATQRLAEGGPENLVVFDLALDFATSARIAIAKADHASGEALDAAAGFFNALGMACSPITDSPGLVVMRTLAMLANEAAEAAHLGVATPEDIDRAMVLGVNYPRGPLAWAEAVGVNRILHVLDALQATYGDDRYRPSIALRRRAWRECGFPSPRSGDTP